MQTVAVRELLRADWVAKLRNLVLNHVLVWKKAGNGREMRVHKVNVEL